MKVLSLLSESLEIVWTEIDRLAEEITDETDLNRAKVGILYCTCDCVRGLQACLEQSSIVGMVSCARALYDNLLAAATLKLEPQRARDYITYGAAAFNSLIFELSSASEEEKDKSKRRMSELLPEHIDVKGKLKKNWHGFNDTRTWAKHLDDRMHKGNATLQSGYLFYKFYSSVSHSTSGYAHLLAKRQLATTSIDAACKGYHSAYLITEMLLENPSDTMKIRRHKIREIEVENGQTNSSFEF